MRLLHTSDWHLGQALHGHDRDYEHERFLAWLLDTLEAQAIDVLLLAGDVYDSANPPSSAQRLFYGFLARAARRLRGLQIVIVAGNHDSPSRLEAPSPLLAALDVTVVGHTRDDRGAIDLERLVLPLRYRDGRVGAWCLALPFLRPGDVPRVETDGDAYAAGIVRLYAQALDAARTRREPGQPIIAMGHCHLAGGQVSQDSERALVIGGTEAVPAGAFAPDIAYVALGHLHLAQRAGGRDTLRYSGSPLPMSFAEIAYPHQVLVVETEGEAVREVREIRVPRSVELLRVPDRHRPLDEALAELAALELAPLPEAQWPYLEVRVLLEGPEPALRSRVEAALGSRPVRLARIDARSAAKPGEADGPPLALGDLDRLDPAAIFGRLYSAQFGGEVPPELHTAFRELLFVAAQGESA